MMWVYPTQNWPTFSKFHSCSDCPMVASFRGTMVDSCLSLYIFDALYLGHAAVLLPYLPNLDAVGFFFPLFKSYLDCNAPEWMRLYFLTAPPNVFKYEEIYLQFVNDFPKSDRDFLFHFIGRAVDLLPAAQQRVWILSGLSLFLVCSQAVYQRSYYRKYMPTTRRFWGWPPGAASW